MTPEEKEFLTKLNYDSDVKYQKIKEQNYDLQQKITALQNDFKNLSRTNVDLMKLADCIIDKESILFIVKNRTKRFFKKILRK